MRGVILKETDILKNALNGEMEKKPIKNSQLLVIGNSEFSKFISKGAI